MPRRVSENGWVVDDGLPLDEGPRVWRDIPGFPQVEFELDEDTDRNFIVGRARGVMSRGGVSRPDLGTFSQECREATSWEDFLGVLSRWVVLTDETLERQNNL